MIKIDITKIPEVMEFKLKYSEDVLNEVLGILMDSDYDSCDDNQCDDEGCRLRKAFKQYMKYRND